MERRRLESFARTLCFFLVLSLPSCKQEEAAAPQAEAPKIAVVKVAKKDVPIEYEFVGQTKGSIDAEIRARVDGIVQEIHFKEGSEVKEGDLLYTIDAAPFQAKLAEAEGKLAEARTMLAKAESDLKRYKPLADINAVSKRDLDAAVAQEGAARGSVSASEAVVDSATIELGYTKVTAPISGTIGLTQAKVGEFVGKPPNPVILNTISKLDPINVKFAVTEKDYLYFARLKQKQLESGEAPQKRVLQLVLADGSAYPDPGELISIDRQIDPKLGSLALEATFPNTNKLIRPGQFARIRTIGETLHGALTVPKQAVRDVQGETQVFVIKDDDTVEQRTVKIMREIGNSQVVESGLTENDRVAVDVLRLRSGMKITPQEQAQG